MKEKEDLVNEINTRWFLVYVDSLLVYSVQRETSSTVTQTQLHSYPNSPLQLSPAEKYTEPEILIKNSSSDD